VITGNLPSRTEKPLYHAENNRELFPRKGGTLTVCRLFLCPSVKLHSFSAFIPEDLNYL
jgi:hypothetical protein